MRPSELYGIQHPVTAYCFDRAVTLFGTSLEADLDRAVHKAKNARKAELARQRVLNTWLGTPMKFRDPAAGGTTPKQAQQKTVTSQADGSVSL